MSITPKRSILLLGVMSITPKRSILLCEIDLLKEKVRLKFIEF